MQPKQTNEDPFLDPAMLLGIIDRLTHSNKRLEGIVRAYEAMARGYDHQAAMFRDEQARSIATLLEAECANCWGPVHSETLRLMGQEAHDGA
jgi:hypothetical protein